MDGLTEETGDDSDKEEKKTFRRLLQEAKEEGKKKGNRWKEEAKRKSEKTKQRNEEMKRKAEKFRKTFGWRRYLKYRKGDPKTQQEMLKEFGRAYFDLPRNFRILFWAVGIIVYSVGFTLLIVYVVMPTLTNVYNFTAKESEAIGIQLEANLISTAAVALVAYLLGKRAGRKEFDYDKMAEAFDKALDKREKNKEKEVS